MRKPSKKEIKITITALFLLAMAAVLSARMIKVFGIFENREEGFPPGGQTQSAKTYQNSKYGFSFESGQELNVSAFSEGEYGETVLIQNSDKNLWVQIFIMPWDETGPITPARIKQDLPDLKIEEPVRVTITQNRIPGLIFWSENAGAGKTRETWFHYNGNLYQISTHAELDNFIGELLENWRFQ